MIYWYRARDPMGRDVEGEIDAPDEARLLAELRGRALTPIRYRPVRASTREFVREPSKRRSTAYQKAPDQHPAPVFSEFGSPPELPPAREESSGEAPSDEAYYLPADATEEPQEKERAGFWTYIVLLWVLYQIIESVFFK